jgi:hypothetical protein
MLMACRSSRETNNLPDAGGFACVKRFKLHEGIECQRTGI